MENLPVLLTALLALLLGVILHYWFALRKGLKAAQSEISHLRNLLGKSDERGDSVERNEKIDQPYIRMVVEVTNPIEVAHRESGLAKLVSNTAPNVVIRKVYERVVRETIEEMKKKNVEANVSLLVL